MFLICLRDPIMPRLSAAALTFCLSGLLSLSMGCQRGDRPEIGEVTGTITLDGSPLNAALVYFSPESGGRPSQASTDKEGKYELIYIGTSKGAKVGKHKVRVTTAYEGVDPNNPSRTVYNPEQVPGKYNQDTELVVDVVPEGNVHNFDLVGRLKRKSGG